MATATIERGSTSVTLPLVAPGSGTPLVSVDYGKPELDIQDTGTLNPRHMDKWSDLATYTLKGRFKDSNAYSDAITLMDLIKSNSNGTPMYLNIDMPEYESNIKVAPAAEQEQAVSIAYDPGRRNQVDVDIGLTRVSKVVGGTDQQATTPTATGTGPIQLTDGTTTVDLVKDIVVERSVGRPKSSVRHTPDTYPLFTDKTKTAYDGFELSFQFVDNAVSQVNDIVSLFTQHLGRESLTLDFNGLYGMGAFNVVPTGSGALRHTRPSGEQGTTTVPKVALRRVYK